MTYRVVLSRLAVADLREAYSWASRRAPQTAARWLGRFHAAIGTLAENPERCPHARENQKVALDLREYLFGRRPSVFRVIFAVDPDRVFVLRIRRAQRRRLSSREIGEALDPNE